MEYQSYVHNMTNQCTCKQYVLLLIINFQHVSLAITLRVALHEYKEKLNCQIV